MTMYCYKWSWLTVVELSIDNVNGRTVSGKFDYEPNQSRVVCYYNSNDGINTSTIYLYTYYIFPLLSHRIAQPQCIVQKWEHL